MKYKAIKLDSEKYKYGVIREDTGVIVAEDFEFLSHAESHAAFMNEFHNRCPDCSPEMFYDSPNEATMKIEDRASEVLAGMQHSADDLVREHKGRIMSAIDEAVLAERQRCEDIVRAAFMPGSNMQQMSCMRMIEAIRNPRE